MNKENIQWLRILMYFLILTLPLISAQSARAETASLDTEITAEEKEQFDQILSPVRKVYNLIKYSASVLAVLGLLFAGISYMFSGNDMRKRDTSKNMATYVVIGLVVIWGAPFVVNLLIA